MLTVLVDAAGAGAGAGAAGANGANGVLLLLLLLRPPTLHKTLTPQFSPKTGRKLHLPNLLLLLPLQPRRPLSLLPHHLPYRPPTTKPRVSPSRLLPSWRTV